MDQEPGRAAAGETEAAAAAAFGDTTRQVGWRRGVAAASGAISAGHFGVPSGVPSLFRQGAAAEEGRRGLRCPGFPG